MPGFSTQPTFLPKYEHGDEIGVAVAVDVERERREVVVVRAHPLHVADVVRLPVRGLVPGVAADDVELAVVVDVEHAGRLELALAVDRVLLPLRLAGPGRREQEQTSSDSERSQNQMSSRGQDSNVVMMIIS